MYNLEWTDPERTVVAESYDPVEAWENYRVKFGDFRTFEAIEREWYRAHEKVPCPLTPEERKEEMELLITMECETEA
jgi:hypothetical protein